MTPHAPRDLSGSSSSGSQGPADTGRGEDLGWPRTESASTEAFLERLRQAPPLVEVEESFHVPGVTILERVGRGGMGIVYRGRIDATGASVAVKVLSGARGISASARGRAEREAGILLRLDHPNIIRLLSSGNCPGKSPGDDPLPYFVMEWIPGGTLETFVGAERLGHRDAARLIREVALALAEVHALGVIHRDIKPANILLGPAPRPGELPVPKLADFGLAGLEQASTALTREGTVLGTPGYLAPEQAGGEAVLGEVGPAADIHGLGATLYFLLAGRPPHEGRTIVESLARAMNGTVNWNEASIVSLPVALRTILEKCLEKIPARRYSSAGDVADDLQAFLDGRPIRARRSGRPERLWGWMRRHPGAVAAVVIAGVSVVTMAAGMRWHLDGIRAADLAKTESRDLARATAARLADENVQQLLAAGSPLDDRGRAVLIEARDTYLDWPIDGDLRESLLFRAKGLAGVAKAFGRISLVDDSAECYAASRATFDDIARRGLADARVNRESLDVRIDEFRFLIESGRGESAEPLVARAIDLAAEDLEPAAPSTLRETLLIDRGFVLSVLGRHDESAPIVASAIAALEEIRSASLDDPDVARVEQSALHNAAICSANAGRGDERLARLRELVQRADDAAARLPVHAGEFRDNAMRALTMLAAANLAAGDPEACLTTARRAARMAESALETHPDDPLYRSQLIESAIWESRAANVVGRPGEAAASIDAAIQLAEAFVEAEPAVFFHTQRLVTALRELAMHCVAVGRPADAVAAYDRIREALSPWKDAEAQRDVVSSWIAHAGREAAGVLERGPEGGAIELPERAP